MIVAVESDIVEGRKIEDAFAAHQSGIFVLLIDINGTKEVIASSTFQDCGNRQRVGNPSAHPFGRKGIFAFISFDGEFIGKFEAHEMKRVCPSSKTVNPNLVRGCSLLSSSSWLSSSLSTSLSSTTKEEEEEEEEETTTTAVTREGGRDMDGGGMRRGN